MTSIAAQQTKLDLELFPKENRLDIGKCNGRIPRGLKPKEETFQVVLDALALTPCFPAFVITADFPKVYMHQIKDQDFDALPSEEDTVSLLRELGHTRVINSLSDVVIDQMHQPWRNFAALINRSLSGKTTAHCSRQTSSFPSTYPLGHVLSKECRLRIVIREPPVETQSKRKEKVDVARGKGIDLLSEVALTEEAQMKEVRKKSLRDFHKSHPSGSGSVAEKPPSVEKIIPSVTSEGTGDKPGVPDVTKDESTESDGDRGMDIDDVQDEKADVGMTDAQQEKENLEITQEQAIEDAHVTITKKTEVPVTKFMNFLLASLTDTITKQVRNQLPPILPEEVSNFAPPMIKKMIQESLNQFTLEKAPSQPQSTYAAAATLTEFELK
nr:hypothetical protein [Tanacetum cinerariifolium]